MKQFFYFFILSLSLFSFNRNYNETISSPWGIDSELSSLTREDIQSQRPKQHPAQSACGAMIRFFQNYIGPIDGPRSSFYPTSSQYALEAIQKYGVFHGIALGCDRLMRENRDVWVYERTQDYGIERKLNPVR